MLLNLMRRSIFSVAFTGLMITMLSATAKAEADEPAPKLHVVATELPLSTPELRCVITCADGLELTGRWVAEDCEGAPKDFVIASATVTTKSPLNLFRLTRPNKGWPRGMYRLDVFHAGRVLHAERYLLGGGE
jgi:hypothetical protein